MRNLIAALEIFVKYQDRPWPTMCGHDVLYITGITKDEVSPEDQARLQELGFLWFESDGGVWGSYRYGSA